MTAQPQALAGDAPLLRHDADAVATLTLNRPARRNALSGAMMAAIIEQVRAIAGDKSVRAVVIAANGPVFCAGHDMKELRANPSRASHLALFETCGRMMQALINLPQPVIAKVHATATAAGCQLVATCDLAVAAETATFATPGVDLGLFCSTPMVALTRAIGRKAAMDMLVTGDAITAARAETLGLISQAVPAAALDAAVAALCAKITSKSPLTVKTGKQAFYRQAEMSIADAYAYTAQVMAEIMMAGDAREGIDAFLQKRQPVWTGE